MVFLSSVQINASGPSQAPAAPTPGRRLGGPGKHRAWAELQGWTTSTKRTPSPAPTPPNRRLTTTQADPTTYAGLEVYGHVGGHCYKVVVGTEAFQVPGAEASKCNAAGYDEYNWYDVEELGSYSHDSGLTQHYSDGDFAFGCTTSDRKREFTLSIYSSTTATTNTLTVSEPSECTFVLTITMPSSVTRAVLMTRGVLAKLESTRSRLCRSQSLQVSAT